MRLTYANAREHTYTNMHIFWLYVLTERCRFGSHPLRKSFSIFFLYYSFRICFHAEKRRTMPSIESVIGYLDGQRERESTLFCSLMSHSPLLSLTLSSFSTAASYKQLSLALSKCPLGSRLGLTRVAPRAWLSRVGAYTHWRVGLVRAAAQHSGGVRECGGRGYRARGSRPRREGRSSERTTSRLSGPAAMRAN